MPNCAKEIYGLEGDGDESGRRDRGIRFEADLPDEAARELWVKAKCAQDGGSVQTFVSDHWTFEYDLAHAGLCSVLWKAAALAKGEILEDRRRKPGSRSNRQEILRNAAETWKKMEEECSARSDRLEYLSCKTYEPLRSDVSKPMTAQHLASLLEKYLGLYPMEHARAELRKRVPAYIRKAIDYATGAQILIPEPDPAGAAQGGKSVP
jgi:putative ATP-dependent endonuclease of OLD family